MIRYRSPQVGLHDLQQVVPARNTQICTPAYDFLYFRKGAKMENLTISKIQKSFIDMLTPENLCIASTLIAPLGLLIFLPAETVFILNMLGLFILTITVFHIRKDRDICKHHWEICKGLLAEETRKLREEINKQNQQAISQKFIVPPEAARTINPTSDLTSQSAGSPLLFYKRRFPSAPKE